MKATTIALLTVTGLGLGAGGVAVWRSTTSALAADHLDPPARTNPDSGGTDRAADIADVYAWHQGTGATATLVTVLTFSGPNAPAAGQATPCDRDVLYRTHVSNGTTTFDIGARFGHDDLGNCFVRVEGIPGTGGAAVMGPTERTIQRSGVKVFAGLRDDPFFFDLTGFRETVAMGQIRMISDRDFFAGLNTSALVLEFPLAAVSPTGQALKVWGTTARIGGGA
ncbi:MAG: DUF4331 family protein [Kofleriaceae bacterium]|nr:DUF4331 family protein [Kofleriaceae bacterium]